MDNSYIPKTQKGLFGNIWAWVLGIVLIVGSVLAISAAAGWIFAPTKGKLEARQQINSGANRIQAYSTFFNLCASITTDDENLKVFYQQLKTASKDDKSRIETNIVGNISDRNSAANTYNTDAAASYTIGQFRDSKLPFHIPPYQKGQVFSCVG